jgi:hypothetical protein
VRWIEIAQALLTDRLIPELQQPPQHGDGHVVPVPAQLHERAGRKLYRTNRVPRLGDEPAEEPDSGVLELLVAGRCVETSFSAFSRLTCGNWRGCKFSVEQISLLAGTLEAG